MRPQAFPRFRKLNKVRYGLPKGQYQVNIDYRYSTKFKGTKGFVIAESTWFGDRNLFLGYMYLIVGSLITLAGFFLMTLAFKTTKHHAKMVVTDTWDASQKVLKTVRSTVLPSSSKATTEL